MIEHIMTVLKLLAAALPFVFLCIGSKRINLTKKERSRQFPMPVIAVLYNIVVVFFLHRINEWLLTLLDNIPKWIARLANLSWLPDSFDRTILRLSEHVKRLLDSLNLDLWVFFLANVVIILAFLFLKSFIIRILNKTVKNTSELYQSASGLFYQYDEDLDVMCVKEEYSQARGFLRVFYYAAVAISVVLFIASRYFYQSNTIRAIFYPVFGIILVGEFWFLLDGLTLSEYKSRVLGEDDRAQRTVNYTLIKEFLRSLFGDKLNVEGTQFNSDLTYSVTNDDVLKPLRDSDDQSENAFALYYESLSKNGFALDHNYLYSSLDLLHGKSILFNNPFYNDLIPYAFYPMNRCLLQHGKVLVVLGRHAIEKDVENWVREGVEAVTNIPFMWKINTLNDTPLETDIGILTRADVLNIKVHDANEEFLNEVSYVVIIEPSKLISTAQIGLNMLVKKCQAYSPREIVYCMCDKNCDGLVDAMSHILLTSITEVSATCRHKGINSYMGWDVDDDFLQHRILPSISRYLGIGTELSFAALRNQVSSAAWYGGEAFPVTDMRWIDRQYYFDLMRYAQLPANQDEMDKRFVTCPNFWGAKAKKNNFITVEDESYNMFEVVRDFSTRATEQGFVNVITSDYLLKEYMADNADIFETDPKAIPCIVPDFVRSRRNTVLKLLLMMSMRPTAESLIAKELSLENISVYSLREQLWHEIYLCFADSVALTQIPEEYAEAVSYTADRKLPLGTKGKSSVGMEILVETDRFNIRTGKMERVFSIRHKQFIEDFISDLKSASYVSEDEKGGFHYFGAELRGHVYQKYLPGQFFTFDGKYYCMDGMTADGDILVRRSADHINGRKYYRQIRSYTLSNRSVDSEIGSAREIAGVKIVHEHADISVHTSGYLEMTRYGDFRTARPVILDIEGVDGINRYVTHKSLLRIELPDSEGKLSDNVRYTITVLMNEIFRSLFAENQGFVVALTDDSFLPEDAVRPTTYSVKTDSETPGKCIYIVEDSRMDLGLLDAVERNIDRILDIISDYICWHNEKLDEILDPPPAPEPVPVDLPPEPEQKKKGFLRRLIDKIFGKKKKKKGKPDDRKGKPEEQDGEPGEGEEQDGKGKKKKKGFFARLIEKLFGKKKKKGEPEEEEPVPEPVPEPEPPGPEPTDELPEPPEDDTDDENPVPPEDGTDDEDPVPPEDDTDGENPVPPEDDTDGENPVPPEDDTDGENPVPPENDTDGELPDENTDSDLPVFPEDETNVDEFSGLSEDETDVDELPELPVLSGDGLGVDEVSELPITPEDDTDFDGISELPVIPEEEAKFEEIPEIPAIPEEEAKFEEIPEIHAIPEEEAKFEEISEIPVIPEEEAKIEEIPEIPEISVPAEDNMTIDESPALPVDEQTVTAEIPVLPENDAGAADSALPGTEAGFATVENTEPQEERDWLRELFINGSLTSPDDENMPAPGESDGEVETVSLDDLKDDWAKKTERLPYNERYYTLFGYAGTPAAIDLDATYDYLDLLKTGKNSLTQARDNRLLSEYMESLAKKEQNNLRYCDFCGTEILGIEYETLADGRDRCINCSRTAIKTGEEFKKLFDNVKHDLESYFNIKINTGVRVEMVNARVLHKRLGETFTPTAQQDGRTLGVAIRKKNQFTLLVENGSPRMATMLTTAHELTHIWQYVNWDEKALRKRYGKDMLLEIYEGMAKWVEVQYAWLMNEVGTAKRKEAETLTRPDEYGRGFIRYRANYPFTKSVGSVGASPFQNPEAPLDDEFCIPLDQLFILPPEQPQPVESRKDKRNNRKDWLGSDRDIRKKAVKGSKNRAPDNFRKYAYEMLGEAEKALYDRILTAYENYEEDVDGLEEFGVTKDRFETVMRYIGYDNPAVFWIAGHSYSYSESTGVVSAAHFLFNMTREEAESRQREIEENIGDFREGITDAMSDFEVTLKVYENIIRLIDYDSIGLDEQEKAREQDENEKFRPDDLRSIYGVFVNRKAVCAGYARATQYLLNGYGLECAYYSNGEHAWNILNLEGDYYQLDTTWGDASNTKPEDNGGNEISYDCFCVTSADIARLKMHYMNPEYPAPDCTALQCNYYRRFGAYFDAYRYEEIRDLATSLAANGSSVIAFRCADDAVFRQVEEALIDQHKFSDILQFINLKTRVRVETSYSYIRRPEYLTFKFYLNKIQ